MTYKKIIVLFFIFISLTTTIEAAIYPIDAEKNAQKRNNSGVLYMKERDYFAAIKEFKIAIAINPNHQTSAVYYNNLGSAYLELGKIQKQYKLNKNGADFASFAQESFESAIAQDCMQLSFYKNLVSSFELQGIMNSKKREYLNDESNPLNLIVVALIEEKLGNKVNAQIMLDDFIVSYPDLLITVSLKNYLKRIE